MPRKQCHYEDSTSNRSHLELEPRKGSQSQGMLEKKEEGALCMWILENVQISERNKEQIYLNIFYLNYFYYYY